MNRIFLQGNVGKDPRITDFENGGKVAQFPLATTERGYTTKDGKEIPDKTTWHNIVVKQTGLAKVCEKYVKKGSALLVSGKVENRNYTDSYGTDRIITEVIVDEMELIGQKREQAPAPGYYAPDKQGEDMPADI
jgi:single-strand DNA-binding protein